MSENTNITVCPDLTPYYAAQVATGVLGRDIQPQVMYTMAKNGTIESNYDEYIEAGGRGNAQKIKVHFDGESFKTWLEGVKAGKVVATGKMNLAALIAEFSTTADEAAEGDED